MRGRSANTTKVTSALYNVLETHNPMTVRQAYYQLVSAQLVENSKASYRRVGAILVEARKDGTIPWNWIEDHVWATQTGYVEAWVEKDALSGIFEEELEPYGVTLNVGRGYDGWDSIRNAASRFIAKEGGTVLYFGDFDPSGEDMARSLRERLASLGADPTLIKIALTEDDIERYHLPPDPAKLTDSRAVAFIEAHGDVSVELDALPVEVLRERIVSEVEARLDVGAIKKLRKRDEREREKIRKALAAIGATV